MKQFEILLWDVDQTLLDFSKSQKDALGRSFQKYGRTLKEEIQHGTRTHPEDADGPEDCGRD